MMRGVRNIHQLESVDRSSAVLPKLCETIEHDGFFLYFLIHSIVSYI